MKSFFRVLRGLIIVIGLSVFGIMGLCDIISNPYKNNNIITLVTIIIILIIILWFFIKNVVNNVPKKTKEWGFWEFKNKYNTMKVCSDFYILQFVVFSNALIRDDVVIDISNFNFLSESELLENGKDLIIVRDVTGKYYMKYKK